MIKNGSNEQNAIQLLDEDDDIRQKEQKIQYQRNRQAIYQAHMGSQFDVLVAVIKSEIKGSQEEKNRVFQSRILKYFNHGSKSINVQTQNFRQRRNPDYSDQATKPIANQLILYGVDFLNVRQIKKKFASFDPQIQWLDDSHCRVKFSSAEDAKSALQINLKNKAEDIVKIQNTQSMQVPKGWFELQPYFYLTLQRRLYGRYAASNQDQNQIKKSNDYYMYQEAKRKFQENLANQVSKQKYFQVLRKYNLIGQSRNRQRINRNNNNNNRNFNRNNDGNANYREQREYRTSYDRPNNNYLGNDRRGNFGSRREYNNGNNQRRFGQGVPYRNRFGNRGQDNQNENRRNNFGRNNRNYNNQQDQQQQRSRQKKNDSIDNISIISRPVSNLSQKPRQRKFSQSICSNSPVRNRNNQQDDNLSFILDQSQINSQQIVTHFNNLSILQQDIVECADKQSKKQEDNISIVSAGVSSSSKPRRGNSYNNQMDTSLILNQSAIMSKNKKNNIDTSIISNQPINKNNSKLNNSKQNLSIEQITIYD